MASTATFTRTQWAKSFLAQLGAPDTAENEAAVVAWEMAEGGHFLNDARFNPLNTTLDERGAHPINSVGVKAYGDYQTGLTANVATLAGSPYAAIRAALAAGNNAQAVIDAVVASHWGTKSITNLAAARKEVASGGGTFTGDTGAADPGIHLPGSDYLPGPLGGNKGILNDPALITSPLDAAKAALAFLGQAAAWLSNRHNWIRVLEVAAGGVGLIVAMFLISQDLRSAAGHAAEVAALA